jgi:hypothetical protein
MDEPERASGWVKVPDYSRITGRETCPGISRFCAPPRLVEMEKRGQQRPYSVTADLKTHLQSHANILELDCGTFRFDRLPG